MDDLFNLTVCDTNFRECISTPLAIFATCGLIVGMLIVLCVLVCLIVRKCRKNRRIEREELEEDERQRLLNTEPIM